MRLRERERDQFFLEEFWGCFIEKATYELDFRWVGFQ